jgi:hypothetical protein
LPDGKENIFKVGFGAWQRWSKLAPSECPWQMHLR